MRKLLFLGLFALAVYYVLDHSFFIAKTGVLLLFLAFGALTIILITRKNS